jgi:hypothetical protein
VILVYNKNIINKNQVVMFWASVVEVKRAVKAEAKRNNIYRRFIFMANRDIKKETKKPPKDKKGDKKGK